MTRESVTLLAGLRAESSHDRKLEGVPVMIGDRNCLVVSVTGLRALVEGGGAPRGGRGTVGSDKVDPEKESKERAGEPMAGSDSPGGRKIVDREPSAEVEVRSD